MVLTLFSPDFDVFFKKKKVFLAKWLAGYCFWSIPNKFNNIHMHIPPPLN